jgi:hypothetical protein
MFMRLLVLDDSYKHSSQQVAEALDAEAGGTRDVTKAMCQKVAGKLGGQFRVDGDNLVFDFTNIDAVFITSR